MRPEGDGVPHWMPDSKSFIGLRLDPATRSPRPPCDLVKRRVSALDFDPEYAYQRGPHTQPGFFTEVLQPGRISAMRPQLGFSPHIVGRIVVAPPPSMRTGGYREEEHPAPSPRNTPPDSSAGFGISFSASTHTTFDCRQVRRPFAHVQRHYVTVPPFCP